MLPNLIVIGAMKCGTSSLRYYLNQHPDIAMSREKELDFFILEKNWDKGLDWYNANFPESAPVRGEAAPNYTDFPNHTGVPERMHSLIPEAKLIYVVRNPVDRIVSHYIHYLASGLEHRSFSEAMQDPNDHVYFVRSMYHIQIEQFIKWYPRSSILILTTEELERGHGA